MARRPVAPETYAAFLGQIELTHLWLNHVELENHRGPEPPGDVHFDIAIGQPRYDVGEGMFTTYLDYRVRLQGDAGLFAEMRATFGARFDSALPMTDPIFEVFRDINLPVNTWPYARELLSSLVGRMGWNPPTMPTFKVGVASDEEAPKPTPKRRSKRASATTVE